MNRAASRLILAPFSEQSVIDTARDALAEVGGHASCAIVFASADYRGHLPDFLELIQLHAHAPIVVGCSGSGLVGTGTEAEGAGGFSLLLLHLPDTKLHVARFDESDVKPSLQPEAWHSFLGVKPGEVDAWLVFGDPHSLPVEPWLDSWNAAYPDVPTLGGLGSGGPRGDDVFVFQNRELVEGAVALGFQGGIRLHSIVSQGCRPIGEPFTITGVEGNLVIGLGSRPAYEVLTETYESLPEEDKRLARGNLFVGLALSEYIDEFKTGDFLVRNLLGGEPTQGIIAIGALPRTGQTLQFQLRDHRSADAELRHLVTEAAAKGIKPFAALLFCCSGRGRWLFGSPNHDAAILDETFPNTPAAGFFCNGEIGPVGQKNFIHGYTASIALFTEP